MTSGSNCRLTFFLKAAIRAYIFSKIMQELLRGNGAVRTSICGRHFLFSTKGVFIKLVLRPSGKAASRNELE